jgi:hypothetical protein
MTIEIPHFHTIAVQAVWNDSSHLGKREKKKGNHQFDTYE